MSSEPIEVVVKLAQAAQPQVEAGLRAAFVASAALAAEPKQIAAAVAHRIGRGAIVTAEAERRGWSRYRVAIRVQGMPVTIATVELTLSAHER